MKISVSIIIVLLMFLVLQCNFYADEIKIPYNVEQERQLQKEVNKGHQPWRLNPTEVAHVAILVYASDSIPSENCVVFITNNLENTVQCNNYKVYLKKLFGEKGMWTAVTIESCMDKEKK